MSLSTLSTIWNNLFSGFGIADLIDIAVVAFVIYKILGLIRETRAEQLVKGLLFLVVATYVSGLLRLYTLNWLLEKTLTLGAVAVVVIFQPELRRGLEYLGRGGMLLKRRDILDKEQAKQLVSVLTNTVESFSASRTGALIVLENQVSLNDIAETGTSLGADATEELLGSIFYEGTPLHDGAVILRQKQVLSAGCMLPLTQNRNLSKELGTRHRAGLGISENSDALVLVVSEESGIISMAQDGQITRFLDRKTVEKRLLNFYLKQIEEDQNRIGSGLFKRMKKGAETK